MNAVGTIFIEGQTGLTLITGFPGFRDILAVDGLCKDPGTGSLTYSPRSAEKIGVSEMIILYGIPECGGDGRLPHHIGKTCGSVLSC
jgi:hypothetical protein